MIKKIFHSFFKNKNFQSAKQENRVQTLSDENLLLLRDQLRLTNSAIGVIKARMNLYVQEHGQDAIVSALNALKSERVVLESKIEALDTFLND